jgi:hypothetical protein
MQARLVIDALDVAVDGINADAEDFSDPPIAQPLAYQSQDFLLAFGQSRRILRQCQWSPGCYGLAYQHVGHSTAEPGLTSGYRSDGGEQIRG